MISTREHILDTAVNLFLHKSYYEVTMQDIVSASGMSKGAFYHYFSSKEKVFEEVISYFFIESRKEDFSQFSTHSLWDFCLDYIQLINERSTYYTTKTGDTSGQLRANQLLLIMDATKLFPWFGEVQQRLQQEELSAWRNVISLARSRGEIKSILEDEQIAKLFSYVIYGTGMTYLLRSQINEMSAEVTQQFRALYQMLKT